MTAPWVDSESWVDSEAWVETEPGAAPDVWISATQEMSPAVYEEMVGVAATRTTDGNLWVTEPEVVVPVQQFVGWGIPI